MKKLSEMSPGTKGRIQILKGDGRFLSRVTSMGLTVGCSIEVLRNEGKQPMLIYSRDTMVALNRKECEKILLEERKGE